MEVLRPVTSVDVEMLAIDDMYYVVSPEMMHETMADSDEEGLLTRLMYDVIIHL